MTTSKPKQFAKVGRFVDPNKVPRKGAERLEAFEGGGCDFLGHHFPEGAPIEYAGSRWVCEGGTWVKH